MQPGSFKPCCMQIHPSPQPTLFAPMRQLTLGHWMAPASVVFKQEKLQLCSFAAIAVVEQCTFWWQWDYPKLNGIVCVDFDLMECGGALQPMAAPVESPSQITDNSVARALVCVLASLVLLSGCAIYLCNLRTLMKAEMKEQTFPTLQCLTIHLKSTLPVP